MSELVCFQCGSPIVDRSWLFVGIWLVCSNACAVKVGAARIRRRQSCHAKQ